MKKPFEDTHDFNTRTGLWEPKLLNYSDFMGYRMQDSEDLGPQPGLLGSLYDGINDDAQRGADLTGSVNSKEFIYSFWFAIDTHQPSDTFVEAFGPGGARVTMSLSGGGGNPIDFNFRDVNPTTILRVETAGFDSAADTEYHHMLVSANMAVANDVWIRIDDVDRAGVPSTFTDLAIDFTNIDHSIYANNAGAVRIHGRLSEYWFIIGTHIDGDIEANRRLFYGADGKPVDLGDDGTEPGLGAPIVYAPDGDPSVNKGTGGNYTITGALTSVAGPGV